MENAVHTDDVDIVIVGVAGQAPGRVIAIDDDVGLAITDVGEANACQLPADSWIEIRGIKAEQKTFAFVDAIGSATHAKLPGAVSVDLPIAVFRSGFRVCHGYRIDGECDARIAGNGVFD